MQNTFQLNEINGVDSLITDLTPGSGVSASTERTLDEHVNQVSPVVVEFGDGDGDVVVQSGAGVGARVGGEGGWVNSLPKEEKAKDLQSLE